ncbi:MAG: fructokinase [Sulfobacillus acidophilus]|uniref:fructokinase n=1 Tax=Sulfobacillus acidophilus TaxID=53633 RepID=A0A2T2WKC8_9FIRM|nr:MAG: fructokinase [Sulfobacillus acidophilus]
MLYGALEAGGTKCLCAVGDAPQHLQDITAIPTTSPARTLAAISEYFARYPIDGIGVASFGPVDLDPHSSDYGMITRSPKQEWQGANFRQYLQGKLGVPVAIDTDVTAALLAEQSLGAALGTTRCVYLTIGTGIGGSFWTGEGVYHGLWHPEIGHIRIPRVDDDHFIGCCPFHGDCLEGLASGEAIRQRWNQNPDTLPLTHRAWSMEAEYLALGLVALFYILVPQRIVLGGGVMQQSQLFPMIRANVSTLLNGYLKPFAESKVLDDVIVPPHFRNTAGLVGAMQLAISLTKGRRTDSP